MRFSFSYGRGMVRFVYLFNYPEGVTLEEGEKWFLGEHVPEIRKMPNIVRYNTWKALPPIPMWTFDPYDRFVRLVELVFADRQSAIEGTIKRPELWQSKVTGRPGFGEFECLFLDEEPQYDLLKDVPVQQFKYIQNPPNYTPGKIMEDDADDVVIDVYMFNYDAKFTLAEGEDWYLGHHVREGRITKQLGHKHYQTWKPLFIPEAEGTGLRPNKFVRLTELGLPKYAIAGFPPGTERPAMLKYTQHPNGRVIGEWRNILIDPDKPQNLLD